MSNTLRGRLAHNRLMYPAKVLAYAFRAPRNVAALESEIRRLERTLVDTRESVVDHESEFQDLKKDSQQLDKQLTQTNDRISNINHKINAAEIAAATPVGGGYKADTIADDHSLDNFYIAFEDKFRGSEEVIKERMKEHLVHFKKNETGDKKLPIVDLGCGRGELLSLLGENNIDAIGVDMNLSMVERAQSNGFKAVQNDAISYLMAQKNNSVAAITGFHLVEHLPFGLLVKMFEECYRVVAKNGYVFFETPNPENIMVGSCNFYMDPSHINPIPPDLLAFALETVGFEAEILRLHPVEEDIDHKDPIVKDIAVHLYGPRDYAVKAYKR